MIAIVLVADSGNEYCGVLFLSSFFNALSIPEIAIIQDNIVIFSLNSLLIRIITSANDSIFSII
jgi:hypothetical protein